jgi:PAS domain S-box-containing protein
MSVRQLGNEELEDTASAFIAKCSNSFDTSDKIQKAFLYLIKRSDNRSIALLMVRMYPEYAACIPEEDIRSESEVSIASMNSVNYMTSNSFLANAMEAIDASELDRLYASGSWLTSLLAAVENLPICVSIATASKSRRGFPMIYVNACFERTTGYSRKEIVGRNCRFLQSEVSEPESLQRLTVALADAKPLKVSITNVRKDGIAFVNFLSLKPIFDDAGEYRYVIGMQFDVTQADATPAKLKLADELMKMLPDEIPSEEADM